MAWGKCQGYLHQPQPLLHSAHSCAFAPIRLPTFGNSFLAYLSSLAAKNLHTWVQQAHWSLYFVSFLQHETRVLRVKVIAGIDLAKKDIIGARWVSITPFPLKKKSLTCCLSCLGLGPSDLLLSWHPARVCPIQPWILVSCLLFTFRPLTPIANQWLATSLSCAPHIPVLHSVPR